MNQHKKILVADDDITNLDFFEVMLSKLGFTVEKANDGIEALDKIKRFHPDLIMMNNIMPRMSGWELTKNLKSNSAHCDIPIIMFSALDDVKDKVESFELGVEDYIAKPFNFSEVLARIKVIFRNHEAVSEIFKREERLEKLKSFMEQNIAECIKNTDDFYDKMENTEFKEKIEEFRRKSIDLKNQLDEISAEWEDFKRAKAEKCNLQTQAE